MGLLENVLGSAVPGGNYSKPLMIAIMALLASGALTKRSSTQAPSQAPSASHADEGHGGLLGGLGGLLDRFRDSGHGDLMNSWIGSGENRPIAPHQMGTALGPDIIKTLAQKSGLPEQELLAQLSKILPGVVDKLTPNGRLPTAAEVAQLG
jgi:uncharacterized protein YidB (DUF937 family)